MWICPVCGKTNGEGLLCERCGFDESLHYKKYRTLEAVEGSGEDVYGPRGNIPAAFQGEPFDVFLCCQEEDESGERTPDSVLAEELYRQLTKEGFRVCLPWITLEGISGVSYVSSLSAALESAGAMVVLGTRPEHFCAVHVRNQWSRYLDLIKNDSEKILIPAYRDMNPGDLPEEFFHLQALDMSGFGFLLDVIREIRKVTVAEATEKVHPAPEENIPENGESQGAEAPAVEIAEKMEVIQENRPEKPEEIQGEKTEKPEVLQEERAEGPEAFRKEEPRKPAGTEEKEKTGEAGQIAGASQRKWTAVVALAAICVVLLIAVVVSSHTGNLANEGKTDPTGAVGYASAGPAQETEEASPENVYEVGSEVRFGTYEQDNDSSDGKEDIEWIVLDKKYGRALLLSKYCLDVQPYDEEENGVWESCSLRGWLNKEFFEDAFSEEEQAQICETTLEKLVIHGDTAEFEKDTVDQVFLLDQKDAQEYLFPEEERQAFPTEYARARGAVADGNADWWLRMAGDTLCSVINSDGKLAFGRSADDEHACVRPAIWIDLGTSQSFSELDVGDKFLYGAYEQDGDSANGKEGIEWLVLDREDNRALVVSEYGLDVRPYDGSFEAVTWETCSLRGWLNGTFLEDAFSAEEQGQIRETVLTNPDNEVYGTEGGNDTTDKIFLLSMEEAEQYFSSDEERQALPTEYTKEYDGYIGENGNGEWWLRSPGSSPCGASGVNAEGGIWSDFHVGGIVDFVRPALWMDIDSSDNTDVGDTIHFGRYEQDNNLENGTEEIEWNVLARRDNSILIISKYCLASQCYHSDKKDTTWEACDLRGWLNADFLNEAFSEEEQVRILETAVENPDNTESQAAGGNDTTDQMFLLSIDEARQYFSSDEARQVFPTEYAKKQRAYAGDNGSSWWWLRSPGRGQTWAADVLAGGAVNPGGTYVDCFNGAVRPAMWITLDP